jgi:hypothetical protein
LLQRILKVVGARPQLVEQPYVFDGDDGLTRKMLQEDNLCCGKRSDFLAVDCDCAAQESIPSECDNECGTGASQIDNGTTQRVSRPISVLVHLIQAMYEILARQQTPMCISRSGLIEASFEIICECSRHAVLCRKPEARLIISGQEAERCFAKEHRLLQQSSKYRRNGAGRSVNDLEDFSGCGQLLMRFSQLAP